MSLINDALKHAKQTQQQNPPPTPPLQFRPVEPGQPNHARAPLWFVGLALALILVVALGATLVWFVAQKSGGQLRVAARSTAEPAPAVAAAAPVEPVASVPAMVTEPPATNTLPAAPPVLKLQAILYNSNRPLAILSGKTVFLGDRVGEFRVLAMTQGSVTIGSATTTNVLSLSP